MEDADLIREDMANTRSALSEKLEALEDRVTTTVKGASSDVTETVEAVTDTVQETVATVKDTVQETVASVKDTVEETLTCVTDGVAAIKSFLDIPAHVERYPWVALGGSVAVGYLLGEFLEANLHQRRNGTPHEPYAASSSNGNGNGRHQKTADVSSTEAGWLDSLKPELTKLKGLALGALLGTVREMVVKAAGQNLRQPVSDIIDSITEKIGGTLVPPGPSHESGHESQPEVREPAMTV